MLSFGLYRDGNVRIVGSDAAGDDSAAGIVDLPVSRTTPSSAFSFLYQARYVWYRRNGDLNYFGNTVETSYAMEPSRRSRVHASAGASRTDSQGITASSADRPLTFLPRTTLTRVFGSIGGSVGAAQRSLVDWEVRAGIDRYKEIPGVTFNNSTSTGARAGWRSEVSERTTIGVAVNLDRFGFDVGSNVIAESLVVTGTHLLGRFTGMTYDAGATRATSNGVSATSGTFRLALSRELSEKSRLNVGVRQSVTQGIGIQTSTGGSGGATRDSGAWISYAQSSPRGGLHGALDGSYWFHKDLSFGNTPGTDAETLNLSGALGWRFNRFLSLSASGAYVYQSDRSGSTSPLDTRYASYGVFLRWVIRGLSGSARDATGT